jgi:hypothetical protein
MLAILTGISWASGSILNNLSLIKSKLFNFIENQFTTTVSGEK